MREKPLDSELLKWAENRSSTVSVEHWPEKVDLFLIPARSIAEVVHHCVPLPDHVRLALLEQHFIEGERDPDV